MVSLRRSLGALLFVGLVALAAWWWLRPQPEPTHGEPGSTALGATPGEQPVPASPPSSSTPAPRPAPQATGQAATPQANTYAGPRPGETPEQERQRLEPLLEHMDLMLRDARKRVDELEERDEESDTENHQDEIDQQLRGIREGQQAADAVRARLQELNAPPQR